MKTWQRVCAAIPCRSARRFASPSRCVARLKPHTTSDRDLKPANIKQRQDGVVKVLDFGLAKALKSGDQPGAADASTIGNPATLPGTVLGTPAYLAPEQARGEAVDKRADIFAFGCVLYEMLSGQRAFGEGSSAAIVARVLERDPDWTLLPRSTPASIVRLLKRCLQKDRNERLRDITDARHVIADAAAGDEQPEIISARVSRDCRSRRRWRSAFVRF